MGRDQITHQPDWPSMRPDDFDRWTRGTLEGKALYLYGNAQDREALASTAART